MNILPVNDKLIMCILDENDLIRHDISIADFTHASSKTRTFFAEIVQQIVRDLDFIEDNTSLAIETMLSVSGLLILSISKVENPELLKKAGSTLYIPLTNSSHSGEVGKKAGRDSDDAKRIREQNVEDILNFTSNLLQSMFQDGPGHIKKGSQTPKPFTSLDGQDVSFDTALSESASSGIIPLRKELFQFDKSAALPESPLPETTLTEVISFSALADIARLATSIGASYKGKSAVYKDDAENLYWLKLELPENAEDEMLRIRGIAAEFGNCLLRGLPYRAFLEEQCTPVIRSGAIKKLMLLNMH